MGIPVTILAGAAWLLALLSFSVIFTARNLIPAIDNLLDKYLD